MHVLDNHINDITARLKAVYDNGPIQEEPSLQEALASYGWILLDSLVAWRTMRFLIKDMDIDENVWKKWFQTPGSYSASQLKGVWKFSEATDEYIYQKLNKHLKSLFDDTIQKKRNSSAHFNGNSIIQGRDCIEIKEISSVLSDVFLFYEINTFLTVICGELARMGYGEFRFAYHEGEYYDIGSFSERIEEFARNKDFTFTCRDTDGREYGIFFTQDGCKAGKRDAAGEWQQLLEVTNEKQRSYQFFKNKGYYQNSRFFWKQ